jgi:hypothetical protein
MIELLPFLGKLGAAFFRFERKKIADDMSYVHLRQIHARVEERKPS